MTLQDFSASRVHLRIFMSRPLQRTCPLVCNIMLDSKSLQASFQSNELEQINFFIIPLFLCTELKYFHEPVQMMISVFKGNEQLSCFLLRSLKNCHYHNIFVVLAQY